MAKVVPPEIGFAECGRRGEPGRAMRVSFLRRVVTPGYSGNDCAVRERKLPFPMGLDRFIVAQNGADIVEVAFFAGHGDRPPVAVSEGILVRKIRRGLFKGKTWPVAKLIKKGTGAYSSMAVFPDGTIGIIYETGNTYDGIVEYYAKLAFARFNKEWLTNGKHKADTK